MRTTDSRLHDVYALLDKGLAAQGEGRLKDAVSAFDEALARQPMLDRRGEAAPAYVAYGESLEDGDRGTALAYLRKALRLDEAGARSSHVRSDISTLEGEDLVQRTASTKTPRRSKRRSRWNPSNARAPTDLDQLHSQLQTSSTQTWRLVAAVVVLALALAGIALVGGGRRQRPATTPGGDGA